MVFKKGSIRKKKAGAKQFVKGRGGEVKGDAENTDTIGHMKVKTGKKCNQKQSKGLGTLRGKNSKSMD